MAGNKSFTGISMEVTVSVILLCAVAIPIINGMPAVTGDNADIINTLIGIIPVMLAVAIILMVVYAVIVRKRD